MPSRGFGSAEATRCIVEGRGQRAVRRIGTQATHGSAVASTPPSAINLSQFRKYCGTDRGAAAGMSIDVLNHAEQRPTSATQ
jgi:hypothetical protein